MHGEEKLKCEYCDFKSKTKKPLDLHIESVHEGKKYQCEICDKECKSKSGLVSHKSKSHKNNFWVSLEGKSSLYK